MSGINNSTIYRQDLKELVEEVSIADLNPQGDRIAPPISVPTSYGRYPILPREAVGQVADNRRAADGSFPRYELNWSEDTYNCFPYGNEVPIDVLKEQLDTPDFFNSEIIAARKSQELLLMGKEELVASRVLDTAVWTGATNTTGATAVYTDAANAKPMTDIRGALRAIRAKSFMQSSVCSVVLSDDLVDLIFDTAEVKAVLGDMYGQVYVQARAAKVNWLANYFGVKEIIETSTMFNASRSAVDGSAKPSKIYSNAYIFVGKLVKPGASIVDQGAIKQLWVPINGADFAVEQYEEPKVKKMVYRSLICRGFKVHTEYGFLITGCKSVDSVTNI
jgi:hypothetical protein